MTYIYIYIYIYMIPGRGSQAPTPLPVCYGRPAPFPRSWVTGSPPLYGMVAQPLSPRSWVTGPLLPLYGMVSILLV